MIAILLAEGFEEIEALTPLDVLRRAGLDVRTIGVTGNTVCGAHGIRVTADLSAEETDPDSITLAIFPGGMPGAANLDAAEITDRIIESVISRGGRLAAICAAPLIFGRRGLLRGYRAVCYPGFESELIGAEVLDRGVVTDRNITTARGMGVALEFSLELVKLTLGADKAEEISRAVMMNSPYVIEAEESPVDAFLPDDLSDSDSRLEVAERAAEIFAVCESRGASVRLDTAERGPRLTVYRLKIEKPLAEEPLAELSSAIAEGISDCVATEPSGNDEITLLITNKKPISRGLRGALSARELSSAPSPLTLYLGVTVTGDPIYQDLSRMPHLLVTGSSEAGVRDMLRAILASILTRSSPEKVKLALCGDGADLSHLFGVSHLLAPPVTEREGVLPFLADIKDKMEERYALLEATGYRSIREYNSADERPTAPLPYIAVILSGFPKDEEADLLLSAILQKSRAVGIHVCLAATANVARELSPATLSGLASRIYLDTEERDLAALAGDIAHPLPIGEGNARYKHAAAANATLIHPPRVTDTEFYLFLSRLGGAAPESQQPKATTGGEGDIILRSVDILVKRGRADAALLTEGLGVTSDVAEATLAALQEIGLVSEEDGDGCRELLLTAEEWVIMKKRIMGDAL